jgi:hypothetical protein
VIKVNSIFLVCHNGKILAVMPYWPSSSANMEFRLLKFQKCGWTLTLRRLTLTSRRCIYIFCQQIYVLNILNMLHILHFFSSKCHLFHNATFFGSCIIHNLHTGCANIKKNFWRQRVKQVKLSTYMPWICTERLDVLLHSFLILTLDGCEWSTSQSSCFTHSSPTEKRVPSTHWIESWMGLRTGLDFLKQR